MTKEEYEKMLAGWAEEPVDVAPATQETADRPELVSEEPVDEVVEGEQP